MKSSTTRPAAAIALSIPNVVKVVVNKGDTIALAMVRNSNVLYRVFKLNQNQYPTQQAAMAATGSVDCEPALCPSTAPSPCPEPTTAPITSTSRSTAPPPTSSTADPSAAAPPPASPCCNRHLSTSNMIPTSPVQPNPMIANVPVPGGVTAAISDGTTLYLAGQQLQPDGLFAGRLSTMNQATNTITHQYSISDGRHSKMLFADNNTLWIGSQSCANGERQKQFAAGVTGQAANYNCLTMVSLGASTLAPQVVPAITQSATGVAAVHVPYPNQNADPYYYGSLTGLCWVQSFNKIYTAYGGQVHIFKTIDGSEIDNQYVAVQGTALDVAYMDAATDDAN